MVRIIATNRAPRLRLGGPIVGRRPEQDLLRAAVAAATTGSGGVLLLVGEAGIGKTRLAAETSRWARDTGMRALRGRATSGTDHYRPLREAFMAALRRTGPPTDERLTPYRAALSRLLPEWRHPDQGAAGPDESPVVLAEAVLRLLTAFAVDDGATVGCLIVLEDLHDADAETLAVLDYLADHLADEPVVLVGTARPGTALVRELSRRRAATVLEITALTGDEVATLAGSCLGTTADQVPGPVLDRLRDTADGIPFHVEELLTGMVLDGAITVDGDGWRPRTPWRATIPASLATILATRADGLGPQTRELLRVAALFGVRFPAEVAAEAAGIDAETLTRCLRAAGDAHLIIADGEPGGYAFRHALTAEALRAGLLPAETAELSRRAASSIERRHPGLPQTWADLAADLWFQAGHPRRTAEIRTVLAERARLQGAVTTAITQAERALSRLVDGDVPEPVMTGLRAVLLDALIDAGEIERAAALGTWLDLHAPSGQRAAVHLRLARAAGAAGRWAEGLRQTAGVRELGPGPEIAAEVDAVEAFLVFGHPAPDRMARAQRLAATALRDTHRPEVACAALEVLASCARARDLDEARELCDRALALADEHHLTTWRVRMLFHLGVLDVIHHVDPARLRLAHETATVAGAVVTGLVIECELAVAHLTRGEFAEAERRAGHAEQTAARLRLTATRLIALALRVCVAAHSGSKSETDQRYGRYRALGGEDVDHAAAVWGLGLGFGALLDDDRERAWHLLDRAVAKEDDLPPHYLSFNRGPHLLLAVLTGKAGRAEHDGLADSAPGRARWNRQFVLLSRAVLDGRAGDGAGAAAAVAEFEELSAPYPLARHLGLRLIGEAAAIDGWGRPREWLTTAENHFHRTGAVRAAAACRERLRAMGVPLRQRRRGSDRIPPDLRRAGVTVREYEVLQLIVERLGNKQIGARLFLSPRTVEKHVAGLLLKTGLPDRGALAREYG
ncbi:helix-turn-helix transcriptional regulator [Actinoplanes derwentensis]|uniref:Regulatory protein, luxR family n=1 Tax=Actinoplanes derwentensis TaxID=113562 RepID=A0A1H1W1F9_9ACTN|nr:AAA family ATPase [Actinoplanes derwentensis]GID84019.1 hypothetical protein Ade03nite_29430 [Actinoplanes derwentensis]SDS90937.1 regulatory protein, luxR family [Actinoplanes derwentensis]